MQRADIGKEKTGIELKGIKAINPANKEAIPVFAADYVLMSYGTGAIMAVPAHDERDFEFAKKYNLPIKMVICPHYPAPTCPVLDHAYIGEGHLVDSGEFTGTKSEEARKAIVGWFEKNKLGKSSVHYKLRDWVFSRQRYWGEPIPLIHCKDCGWVSVPDKDLPLKLPKVKNYQPRDDGQSPLASVDKWVNVKCPQCKGPAKRETDTMPNWAGSSWYFLRYVDPKNKKVFADPKKLKYFMPVDWYNGGMEHTVLHLLYSRFWNRFLYDIGVVPVAEPYKKRTSHGLILAEGGVKMSKSKGNVINPDDIVKKFGADTLRLYEMFMGPFDQAIAWNTDGLVGMRRFIDRIYKTVSSIKYQVSSEEEENKNVERLLHQTIKKVTEDIEGMRFNTALSALMVLFNAIEKANYQLPVTSYQTFLKLLAPFAPHMSEELYQQLSASRRTKFRSIFEEKWPKYDAKLLVAEKFDLIIQVNGRVRDKVSVPQGISQSEAEKIALGREKVKSLVSGGVKKVVYVPGRLINIVV